MNTVSIVRRFAALLVIIGMVVWLAWLFSMTRSKLDYVVQDARSRPLLPTCDWVPVNAPSFASLGLSFEPTHAWTNRKDVIVAFRTESSPKALFADVGLVAVAGGGVSISADGAKAQRIESAESVRIPLHTPRDGVHSLQITTKHALPPHGDERRWLGVAISAIRVCPAGS